MKIIDTTCPKCKATMEVHENDKEIVCEYCGHKFIMKDDVKKIKHYLAGEIDEEQEYKNASTNLNKFKDYSEAFLGYEKLSKRYVDNPEVWIGLLRSSSHDFTSKEYNTKYVTYWNKYISLADNKDINKYKEKYDKYISSFDGYDVQAKVLQDKSSSEEKDMIYIVILGGMFGVHKFIKGEVGMGILYLFTFGLFGMGWIYDIYKEVKKYPNLRAKSGNAFGILLTFMGLYQISVINNGVLGPLMILASGILCFDKVTRMIWKNPVDYSKYIKIALVVLGFILTSNNI